ncbi:hypothetical protein B0E45_26170 [Sinorhizobium sp. A49]|uniref:hypothetical protein n=1 Tax=Sinorhizobium sp. A49 TaxID=1945861 RepID=UPI0009853627|nr:hypothetical protein [Sinorhizobium sp. A49]OOG66727.1 hypothetical protein B0E45_26170 [Sinorhizobium sp. A49]
MAEQLTINQVLPYLSAHYVFSLHVPSDVVWFRDGPRFRRHTFDDRVFLLEAIQHRYKGVLETRRFSMRELEWCIHALASKKPFYDLPLCAIADDKPVADGGGGGFTSDDSGNGGEGER